MRGSRIIIPSPLHHNILEKQQLTYILVADYFTKYIEISKLDKESSQEAIKRPKSIFARHGIPQQVMSDNGTQYSSIEFYKFAKNTNLFILRKA